MIRKLVIALSAVAVLGATALAPTEASAKWKGKHWHGPHLGILVAEPVHRPGLLRGREDLS